MLDVILKGTWQTLYMVFFSTLIAVVLGFIPAVVLTLTAEDGLKPNRIVYGILDGNLVIYGGTYYEDAQKQEVLDAINIMLQTTEIE